MISCQSIFYRNVSNLSLQGFPWKQEPRKNFIKKSGIRFHSVQFGTYTFSLYLILRKYSTENENFSLPKKKKSRKPSKKDSELFV